MLTVHHLRGILSYDPETGRFFWLKGNNQKKAGDRAGTITPSGYRSIMINGKSYREHRLAWLWMTGNWPTDEIDHINLVKTDNRWSNLREASHANNCANRPRKSSNALGVKGIRISATGKYVARIMKDGAACHLGVFLTLEEAKAAYSTAAKIHHGEFARTA